MYACTSKLNTGTTLIASISSGRHCVRVESNSLQYIWAKICAIKAIIPTTTDKNDEERNEAEDEVDEAGSEDRGHKR